MVNRLEARLPAVESLLTARRQRLSRNESAAAGLGCVSQLNVLIDITERSWSGTGKLGDSFCVYGLLGIPFSHAASLCTSKVLCDDPFLL